MLATGGSAIRAIEVLNENNCYDVTLVCLLPVMKEKILF